MEDDYITLQADALSTLGDSVYLKKYIIHVLKN